MTMRPAAPIPVSSSAGLTPAPKSAPAGTARSNHRFRRPVEWRRHCVSTIEHLLAALAGSAIDNAIVELDGPEVPIMDGSAAPFLHLIDRAGTSIRTSRGGRSRSSIVAVSDGEARRLLPDHGFSLSFEIDFANR